MFKKLNTKTKKALYDFGIGFAATFLSLLPSDTLPAKAKLLAAAYVALLATGAQFIRRYGSGE